MRNNFGFWETILIASIVYILFNFFISPPAPKNTVTQNQAQFLQGDKPVILMFYADYCGACRRFKPVMNKLAEEYSYSYRYERIDTNNRNNYELADAYNVRSIPTIYLVDPAANRRHKLIRYTDINLIRKQLDDFIQ